MGVPLSGSSTAPVGVTPAGPETTLAVKVTGWPNALGLVWLVSVVVVSALMMVWSSGSDTLPV
jgi:hypothetical protein